jgi:Ca2+-binding RTX toxin-like protein
MANRLNARNGATGALDHAEGAAMVRLDRDGAQAAAGACPCGCGLSAQPDHVAAPTYVTDHTALIVRNTDGSVASISSTPGRSAFYSYSFETAVPEYSRGDYSKQAVNSVRPMTEAQKDLAREALAAWGAASGITFFEVAAGQGDMKFIKLQLEYIDPKAGGFAFFPGGTYDGQPSTSDVYIDHESANWLQLYLHEIGHALGLKHPFEGDIRLDPSVDNYGATVMSYTPDKDPKDQLGYLDYDAIRYLYGDNAQDGKHVAGWTWNQAKKTLTQYGFDNDETILGIGGNDVIHGNAGNDMLQGREGSDVLHGGEGNDTLLGGYGGGKGLDRLNGGNGDDLVEIRYGQGSKLAIDGGAGTDQITFWFQTKMSFKYDTWVKANKTVGVEKVLMSAASGNFHDTITGGALADTIWGHEGNDTLSGMAGNDSLAGGAGNDRLSGHSGNDTLSGEAGNDKLAGSDGDDSIWGGDGIDTISGGAGIDRLSGDAGADTLDGDEGDDLLWAGADNDTLRGGAGKDYLDGGAGDDLLSGGEGADNIWGGDGIDTVSYAGEASGVTVTINTARELTPGVWEFLNGIENLTGTARADMLTGDGATNVLNGGGGNDRLNGAGGNDRLIGSTGVDRLTGGAGADRFAFDDGHSGATRTTADQILDFSHAQKDKIDLKGIDAIAGSGKDDAFHVIGAKAFSGNAGELRWTFKAGVTFVEGDTNGDGKADFALMVEGDRLVANDFIL